MTRVFVTGMGLVTGLGAGVASCFDAVIRGESASQRVDRFAQEGLPVPVAAPVDRARVYDEVGESGLPFVSALIVHTARQALAQAELSGPIDRMPLIVANTIGSPAASERQGGWSAARPEARETLESYGQASLVAAAAESLGASGLVDVVGNTCAAGNYAIGLGLDAIRHGSATRVLVGGAEELSVLPFCAFSQLRAIGDPCRPFDAVRNGMLFGEGGAMLVLESEESARSRGVSPLGEVLAVAYSNDAYHLVAPDATGSGLECALRRLLAVASAAQVDYVNAHGTGTQLNDATEARTLARVFGDSISVSSTKAATGHCMGAASAVEAVLTIESMRRGTLLPNANLVQVDAEVPVNIIAEPKRAPIRCAVSVGLGFGGNNAVLALGHPGSECPVEEPGGRTVYLSVGSAMVAELVGATALAAEPATIRANFDSNALLGRKGLRHVDRGALVFAAAMEYARDRMPELASDRVGACVGSAFPAYGSIVAILRAVQRGGPKAVPPMLVPFATVNCASSWWLLREGITGFNGCPVTGECAGLHAVAWARSQVSLCRVDAVLAGATEGYCAELWEALGGGLVEGAAGVWVQSSKTHARAKITQCEFAFDRSDPHAALDRATYGLSANASRAFVAQGSQLDVPTERVEFNGLSVSGVVALLRALQSIEPGEHVLVACGSRMGFAAAILLEGV